MAVGFNIEGHTRGITAAVQRGDTVARERPNGLVVYSSPYEIPNYTPITAVDVDGLSNLGIDGTVFAASELNVHNGTDAVYWAATATTGSWVFNSIDQAFTGTKSISGVSTVDGDTARFDGTIFNPNNYISLNFRVYISQFNSTGTKSVNVQLYTSSNTATGGTVNLLEYVLPSQEGVWQLASVPLSAFGDLGTDVARLDIVVGNTQGNPIDFYLDDIQFISGGGREFRISPVDNEVCSIYTLDLVVLSTDTTTRINDINPVGFLFGAALTEGIVFKTNQINYRPFSYTLTRNFDLITFPGGSTSGVYGDGTTAMLKFTLTYPDPVELNPKTGDSLSIIVNDDLSSYGEIYFQASASTLRKPDLTSI